MNEDTLLLGIDIGTSSTKALICDGAGHQVAAASASHPVRNPRRGWSEADPYQWWSSVTRSVREATASARTTGRDPGRIQAVGLSGQMHGAVLVDAHGVPTRPAILWPDERSTRAMLRYQGLPEPARARLGNPLLAGTTGPILCWLTDAEPAAIQESSWVLQCKDWIRHRLTGRIGGEHSDASATLLYDLAGGDWDDEIIRLLGIPRALLPPLAGSATLAGTITPGAAADLGIAPGIPVAYGAADVAAGLLGSAATPGDLQLTVGTGAQFAVIRERSDPDADHRYHVFRTATTGYYALAAVQAAGLAFEWAWKTLGITWADAYTAFTSTPFGANGVSFVPHIAGARSPSMDASATGAFRGLRLGNDRADLIRAVFDGVAFSLLDAVAALPEYANAHEILLTGGGSRRQEWTQLICDVLDRPLRVLDGKDASARGAAALAGLAIDAAPAAAGGGHGGTVIHPGGGHRAQIPEAYHRWASYRQHQPATAA